MKTITTLILSVLIAATTFATDQANAQKAEPEKRPGPVTPNDPTLPTRLEPPAGPSGAPTTMDDAQVQAELDASMAHMALLVEQSQRLSESFTKLATLHHGADKSEILTMQRISAAMGAMASEMGATLTQYKAMVDDETSSDSGSMRADVDELRAVLDVIAGEVDGAVKTLQRLEVQLGQG